MAGTSAQVAKSRKKNFSSFSYAEALKHINLEALIPWELDVPPVKPTPLFPGGGIA